MFLDSVKNDDFVGTENRQIMILLGLINNFK